MHDASPLEILKQHGTRIVSAVAASRKRDDEVAIALFNYVSSWRRTWTLAEWVDELKKLDTCNETVDSWLQTCWL